MNRFLGGKDISIDLGLDESNHGMYSIGNGRSLRFAALVKSNHTELIVIICAHMLLNPKTAEGKCERYYFCQMNKKILSNEL